jgi:two-component system, chemotaxis family, protein-glutamate methylesterase/glutaminase
MARQSRDLVVVGASAGGVEALRAMAAGLPPGLAASVLVVLHMPAGGVNALASILSRAGPLPAVTARHGEPMRHGRIHVVRSGHHLLVDDGAVVLSQGPAESGHRPAVDALFRSAAVARGAAVVGVLLSGMLDDGVAGLRAIAECGGRVIVQEPVDARYPAMPHNAMRVLAPDHVVRAADIGEVLAKLVEEEVEIPPASDPVRWENDLAALDRALWTALRALEEKVALARRMADRAQRRGDDRRAAWYLDQVREAESAAKVLHRQVTGQV